VLFAGHRDDAPDWLAAANVVVAPSRWEGMSVAMLEAMACGRSVVATAVPGAAEALGGGGGAVVPQGDVGAFADAVVARLLDPVGADAEGARARAYAEERFDRRRTHDEVAALYAELLDARRGSRTEAAPAAVRG
jgi:glycosyltransferase involved in cell wall biosynthesis